MGFIFVDLVYTASIINYAIQSELIVYLLNTISKAVDNQALDRSYMVNKLCTEHWLLNYLPRSHDIEYQ